MKSAAIVVGLLLVAALPRQSAPTVEKARELVAAGKLKEAADNYSSLIVINPAVADFHVELIRIRLAMNDVTGAINAANDALAASPQSAEVAAAVADVQFRIAQFPQATRLYTRATQLDPGEARGWWGLGRLYRIASLGKKARESFAKAHQLDPNDPDIVLDWALTHRTPLEIAAALREYLKLPTYKDPQRLEGVRHDVAWYEFLRGREECRLYGAPAPARISIDQSTSSEFIPSAMGSIGIKAAINGKSRVVALGSTSGAIVVTSNFAKEAKLVHVLDTPVNSRKDYVAFADSIRIGNLEYRNCRVNVVDRPSLGNGTSGMMGLEIFSDYLTQIDLKNMRMRLEPLPALASDEDPRWQDRSIDAGTKDFVPVLRLGHQFLIDTKVSSAPPALFTLALEDVFTILSPQLGRQFISSERTITMNVFPSPICDNPNCVPVAFDRFTVRTQAWPADLSNSNFYLGTEVSGRLGRDALRRMAVTFDFRNGLVKFED